MTAPSPHQPFKIGDWVVDPRDNRIHGAGRTVRLEPKVMQVLVCLAAHAGEVMSREVLEAEAWAGVIVSYDSLTRTVIKLRKAFDDDPRQPHIIETVSKKGYRLIAPVGAVQEAPQPPSFPPAHPRIVAGLGVLLVLLSGFLAWWQPWTTEPVTESPARPVAAQVPSIAVLAFANLSGKDEFEYFSDGITDEIITSLSRLSGLLVISRTSSFAYKGKPIDIKEVGQQLGARYVLEGSVRRYGGRVRINAHFIDAMTGFQLWAERYDRPFEDVLGLQDEITRRIVGSLSVELSADERRALARRYTNDMQAFDYFLRGQAQFVRHTPDDNRMARKMFTGAIERDPAFARAYGAKALTFVDAYRFSWGDNPEAAAEQALTLARKAVALDIDSPEVNWVLGYVELFVSRDPERAIAAGEQAIVVDPNSADAYALLARAYLATGKPERARELIEKAMRLNPHYPSQYPSVLGYAHFFSKRYDSAIIALEDALRENPERLPPNVYLVATYVRSGRMDDAKWQAETVRSIDPRFVAGTWVERQAFSDRQTADRLVADLQRAGL